MSIVYPFTEAEANAAHEEWGCNCGPTALAFALQLPLERVRNALLGFDAKRYTNPTMMRDGLKALGARTLSLPTSDPQIGVIASSSFSEAPALIRIQWTGPWTKPGVNPKWSYRQTHWICAFKIADCPCVFDCNGGMNPFWKWVRDIPPLITANIPRADGGWFPTHIWRVQ